MGKIHFQAACVNSGAIANNSRFSFSGCLLSAKGSLKTVSHIKRALG